MIAATFEKSCIGKGGIYLVYQSLEHFGVDLLIQEQGELKLDKDYDLVIGFGQPPCMPPKGNYKRAMVFCSPLLQSELSGEIKFLAYYIDLLDKGELDYLFITDGALASSLTREDGKIRWLPICDFRDIPVTISPREGFVVTGASRPNKNFFNQVLALDLIDEVERVSLIGDDKSMLIAFLDIIRKDSKTRKKFEVIPSKETYQEVLDIVASHKFLMQVSLSESFCYAVWEAAMMGIPSLCTTSTNWYCGPMIGEYCIVADFDSSEEIIEQINILLVMSPEEYGHLCKEVKQSALNVMKFHHRATKKLFDEISTSWTK